MENDVFVKKEDFRKILDGFERYCIGSCALYLKACLEEKCPLYSTESLLIRSQTTNEPACWHLIYLHEHKETHLLFVTADQAEDIADKMEDAYDLYAFPSYKQAQEFASEMKGKGLV